MIIEKQKKDAFIPDVREPAEWTQFRKDKELSALLKRLFASYRAFQGYGQNL